MVAVQPAWTLEAMNATYKVLLSKDLKDIPQAKLSPFAFIALQWSILVLTECRKSPSVNEWTSEIKMMFQYQSQFYQMALYVGNAKIKAKVDSILSEFWTETDFHLDTFEYLIDRESEPAVILMLTGILNYMMEDGRDYLTLFEKRKDRLFDHFIKTFITVKEKPNPHYLDNCTILINSIADGDFTVKFLPAIQKAMLRNPEIVLKVAGRIFNDVEIDLSSCAPELGKVLIQNLYSNNADTRNEALESLKGLYEKCEDAKAVHTLLQSVFQIWNNGVDGKKITLIEHRLSILRGVGHLSYSSALPEDLQDSMKLVTDNFFKILASESHEKLLCLALEVFSLWVENLIGDLPKLFLTTFKAGLENKTSTQSVRIAYMEWLLCCLDTTNICWDDINALVPILLKFVEKLAKEQKEQHSWVTINEGLCASCLIIRLLEYDTKGSTNEDSLRPFWTVVLDTNKPIFVQDKFLANIPVRSLKNVMFMVEKLLNNNYDRLKGDNHQYLYKAVVHCLLANDPIVRSYCLALSQKLTNSTERGSFLVNHILVELRGLLATVQLTMEDADGDTNGTAISVSAVVDMLKGLCSSNGELLLIVIYVQ